MQYRFELDVLVTDVARLYELARERVIEDGLEWGESIGDEEVAEQLGTPQDPNIAACVETLFEQPTDSPPGTRHHWIPKMSSGVRSPSCTASEPASVSSPGSGA